MPRVLSEEHKRKLQAGRSRRRAELQNTTQAAVADPATSIPITNTSDEWSIYIEVDWRKLPLLDAQIAYAELRKEFENAARILNDRSMPAPGSYVCFMCQITHPGEPRGRDLAYENPETGLREPVSICGENCWIQYQDYRIKERSLRNDESVGLIDHDQYIEKLREVLASKRVLQHQKMLKTA